MAGPPPAALHTARELLLRTAPYGRREFQAAQRVLDAWKTDSTATTETAFSNSVIPTAVALLERLVQETTTLSSAAGAHQRQLRQQQYRFLVEPGNYNPVLHSWKHAALATISGASKTKLMSAPELWERLQSRQFRYNWETVTILVEVLLAQERHTVATLDLAEQWLFGTTTTTSMPEEQQQEENESMVQPDDASTYTLLLQAWADSGLPEASDRMDALMNRLHSRQTNNNLPSSKTFAVTPNVALYSVWLNFWSEHNEMDKLEALVQKLKKQQRQLLEEENGFGDGGDVMHPTTTTTTPVPLDPAFWTQVVHAYCRVRQLDRAADTLDTLLGCLSRSSSSSANEEMHRDDQKLLAESVFQIVWTCRQAVENKHIPKETRAFLLRATERVVKQYARPERVGVAMAGKYSSADHAEPVWID